MGILMMLAACGGQTLKTKTFTANETWPVPAGVTLLTSLVGQGAAGSSASTAGDSAAVAVISYSLSGSSGIPGTGDWSSAQSAANYNLAQANAGGTVAFQRLDLTQYPDGTQASSTTSFSVSNVVAGTASVVYTGGWQSSGPITASGNAIITYTVDVPGAPGASTTGFGKTFPGGAAGSPASPTSFTNVAVTPLASYPVVVPAGGSLTITYME